MKREAVREEKRNESGQVAEGRAALRAEEQTAERQAALPEEERMAEKQAALPKGEQTMPEGRVALRAEKQTMPEKRAALPEGRQALREQRRHGQPGFPMVVYDNDFTQYAAEQIPWHWHEELEFVVVTQGCAECYAETQRFLLYPGEGIFFNRNVLHHMKPRGEELTYMFSVLLHPGLLEAGTGALLTARYVTPYLSGQLPCVLLRGREPWGEACVERLREIYRLYREKPFGYEYALRNLSCGIWLTLVRDCWGETPGNRDARGAAQERIYRVLSYIEAHFAEPLTLEDLCSAAAVSRTELCRSFRRTLRMTPFTYLLVYRMNAAAARLTESADTVARIAEQCGFESESYFCRQFRRCMGCTPLAYRRRYAGTEGNGEKGR